MMTRLYSWSRLRDDIREILLCYAEPICEAVYICFRIVYVEACPRRRGRTEPLHERLGAVMAGAHGDPVHIKNRRDVMRMHSVEIESHDAGTEIGIGRTVDGQTVDFRHLLHGIGCEMLFMLVDIF